MNSAVRTARMNPDELEKEKKSLDDQILEKESNLYFSFSTEMGRHIWGDLNARKSLGNRAAIRSATIEKLDSVKKKYFYPNNAVLIIGGDVTHEQVFNEVAKLFGDWQASNFDPFKKWPVPEFKKLTKSDYFIWEAKSSKLPAIYIQWQGPDTRNDIASTYAADVFSYLINEKLSKFNEALVQSGLALSTNINYLTLKHVGPISLIVRPNPSRVKECMESIKKQIDLMDSDDYLSDEQIKVAKRMLEIKEIRREEITSDYIHTLAFWWASASIDYFLSYNNNLQKVSKKDIKAYVQKYIKGKPYCAGLMISPELKKQLTPEVFFTSNN
jgi:zinc protease